jgi:ribosomal protein S13
VGHGGARPIARLKKLDVERLLADYDADPVGALTVALRVVTGIGDARFPELLVAAGVSEARQQRLTTHDPDALDDLVRELNELRTVAAETETG